MSSLGKSSLSSDKEGERAALRRRHQRSSPESQDPARSYLPPWMSIGYPLFYIFILAARLSLVAPLLKKGFGHEDLNKQFWILMNSEEYTLRIPISPSPSEKWTLIFGFLRQTIFKAGGSLNTDITILVLVV